MDKAIFPSTEWMQAIKDKLNTDPQYAQIARNWEGDIRIVVQAEGSLTENMWVYLDLWHGKCRDAYIEDLSSKLVPAFTMKTGYINITKLLSGEVGIMQALMTRMLSVKGNFPMLMRNVPTILDFVRCCQEVTSGWM